VRTASARGVIAQKESTFLFPGIVFASSKWRKNSLCELIWRIRLPIMQVAKEFATTLELANSFANSVYSEGIRYESSFPALGDQ